MGRLSSIASVIMVAILAVVLSADDDEMGCKQHFLDQIMEEYTMCIRFLNPENLLTTKFGNVADRCRFILSNMTHCNVHLKGSLDNCINDAQKYSALLLTAKELAHGNYLCRENGKYITEFWVNKGPLCLKSLPLNKCNPDRKFHHYQDGSFCRSMASELQCLKDSLDESKSCKEPTKQLLVGTLEAAFNVTSCDMFLNEPMMASQIRTVPRYLIIFFLITFSFFASCFL